MPGADDLIRSGAIITGRTLAEAIKGERGRVVGAGGAFVTQASNGAMVNVPEDNRGRWPLFMAELGGATRDGANYRWTYSFDEHIFSDVSFSTEGRTGGHTDTIDGMARNLIELGNGSSGLLGNGIDVDELPEGFDVFEVPDGTIVPMWLVRVKDGEGRVPVFSVPNGVRGTCAAITVAEQEIQQASIDRQTLDALTRRWSR